MEKSQKINLEKGGSYKSGASRRDFLKLVSLTAASAAGVAVFPYTYGTSKDQGGQFPKDKEETSKSRESVSQSPLSLKLQRLSALITVLNDPNQDRSLKDYFIKLHNINERSLASLTVSDSNTIDIADLSTIVHSLKTTRLFAGINSVGQTDHSEDLGGLLNFIAQNKNKNNWRKVVESNNLGKNILNLGLKGKKVLKNISVDLTSHEFQKSLLPQEVQTNFGQKSEGFYWQGDVQNTVLNIIDDEKSVFYQFAESMTEEKLKPSRFILNKINRLTSEESLDLNSTETKEFISFESVVYNEYRNQFSQNPDLTEKQFYQNLVSQLTDSTGEDKSDFVSNFGFLLSQFSTADVESLLKTSPSKFKQLINTLSPQERGLFHNKKSRLQDTSSYQMLLSGALLEDTLNLKKLLKSVNKFSGNLYLQNIVDRKTMEGENNQKILLAKSFEPQEIAKSIINGDLTLEQYASKFFGTRRLIVANESGESLGTIINSRISEPVIELPKNIADILHAVEGQPWINGKKYIETITKRNLRSAISDEPSSGGSDPAMQLMEIIFPSPYDSITSLSDTETNEYTFRRPDLYGADYLFSVLIPAVRDGLPVDQIYDYSARHFSPDDLDNSTFNRLCAKLESYVLARDLRESFGQEALDKLYATYVPIGNATGEARGLQMQGLETGANYYFNKSLADLSSSEACVLIGMIQSPINYGPIKWKGTGWIDNRVDCFERATKVASMCEEKIGFNKDVLVEEIYKVNFALSSKPSWVTTLTPKQISSLKPGTLESLTTGLDLGIQVIKEPSDVEYIPKFPTTVDLPNRESKDQQNLENWFSQVISKEQLKLVSKENSPISKLLKKASEILESSFNEHDDMIEKITIFAKTINPDFDYNYWEGKKFGKDIVFQDIPNRYEKGDPRYDLWNSLYELHSTPIWQCGQCAIILNDLFRLSSGYKEPTMFVAGNVKNWIGVLTDKDGGPDKEYFQQGQYEVINLEKKVVNQKTAVKNPITLFNVGDMVISWRGHDYGHASTVIDKGIDSQGRHYMTVFDANYQSNGKTRTQTIWEDKLPSMLYPGKPHHMALIRPLNLSHGQEVPLEPSDKNFLDKMIIVEVDNKKLILPGFEQEYLNLDGVETSLVNPGFASSTFDGEGFKSALDRTNLLGTTPTPVGNGIKPFVYAYALLSGVDPKTEISILPGQWALDGSDAWVANAAALGFNLQGVAGTVTFEEALASGVDVPFQIIFKELMEKNSNTWTDFQEFLSFFGIPLVDWNGDLASKPLASGASGRDGLVPSLDSLGFALACVMNPEELIGDIPNRTDIVEALKMTKETILNSKLRQNLMIGDNNPIKEEIGDDLTSPSISNGTNDVIVNGQKLVWSGTNLGDTNTGIVFGQNGQVTVSVTQGQILNKNASIVEKNLNHQYSAARSIGNPALGLMSAKISVA